MILSSRANPPRPLNVHNGRHLSVRQLLLRSPVPSPSLPSILPRHGKKPPPLNGRKVLQVLCVLASCVTIYWMYSLTIRTNASTLATLANLPYLSSTGKSYEIVTGNDLPQYPTPIGVENKRGKQRWSVSIPKNLGFPLHGTDYSDICSHVEEVSRRAAGRSQNAGQVHRGYYEQDSRYVDVAKAQNDKLLPEDQSKLSESDHQPQCTTTLTYVLDATDAGLGSTLLSLWLAYGLAKYENRAFFIDDTQFTYGNYSTFFKSPKLPECRPPPATQRVPCPHQAAHLVVSAATTQWTFGETFQQHFSSKEIFEMAREGYQALFNLRAEDANYVTQRISQLHQNNNKNQKPKSIIGVHVRRGDRHPFEFTYQQAYLPTHIYMSTANQVASASTNPTILLASDDPDIYSDLEMLNTIRAQDKIVLASKRSLGGGSLGWEGGFYKDLFWQLGLPFETQQEKKRIGSPMPAKSKDDHSGGHHGHHNHGSKAMSDITRDYRTNPTKDALQLREFIGRAYLLELSILSQTDRVVCAVSSYTCRVLAVMLGWESAFEKKHWINVDGMYAWRALDV